jgi:hypothetical protein
MLNDNQLKELLSYLGGQQFGLDLVAGIEEYKSEELAAGVGDSFEVSCSFGPSGAKPAAVVCVLICGQIARRAICAGIARRAICAGFACGAIRLLHDLTSCFHRSRIMCLKHSAPMGRRRIMETRQRRKVRMAQQR